MHTRILILALTLMLAGCADPAPEATLDTIALEGATIFDGVSAQPLENAVLVIEGARIREVGERGSVEIPADATVLQVRGMTIIPALMDAHVHVGLTKGTERHADNYTRDSIERDANANLYYGVTHIASLGFDREPIFDFRAAQRGGHAGGARVFTAGAGFVPVGGWTPPVALGDTVESQWIHRPQSIEEAREAVRREAERDTDFVKMWVDGGRGRLEKFPPDMFGAIIEEAHRHGMKTLAHMVELADAKELVRRGIDALAHNVRDREVDDEFLMAAKNSGVTLITTLTAAAYVPEYGQGDVDFLDEPSLAQWVSANVLDTLRSPEFAERYAEPGLLAREREHYAIALRNTKKMAAAGIPIVVGTDAGRPGTFPGFWAHRELELLVAAGLTPSEALYAGTIQAARFLGVDDRAGSLEVGKQANFIVLEADPIADIVNTRRIHSVWFQGREVDRAALSHRLLASSQ